MEVLQLYRGYENVVKFFVKVSGVNEAVSDIRFVVELEGFGVVLPGKVDGDVVVFDFGKVVDLIRDRSRGMMEVYLRNQRFIPFECEVEVVEPVVVERVDKKQEGQDVGMVLVEVKRVGEKKEEEIERREEREKRKVHLEKRERMKFLVR